MAVTTPAAAFELHFDYRFDTQGRVSNEMKGVLGQVNQYFSARIGDTLTAIVPDPNPFSPKTFTGSFADPETTGVTQSWTNAVPLDTVLVFVGMNDALPSGPGPTLAVSNMGTANPSSFDMAFNDNAKSRGQDGALSDSPTDFGPWGGSLSFNPNVDWYLDDDVSTVEAFSGQYDFYSTALHEIAHLLGFGVAPSWLENWNEAANTFGGAAASQVHGGPVLLAQSGIDSAHWSEGTAAGGLEAAMDPTLAKGQRKLLTTLDMAALSDIGWDVSEPTQAGPLPTPLPPAAWLFGSALALLLRLRSGPKSIWS